ncbi:putative NAD(P)H quinone oxidoreductase, PIG3 family [Friedmanniella luteola]|uniref:Putative NAD(P)H quinone oxidoreductase, PIG3 family n=1 Tax=Friedmanniella luteola TaxID=546871 RepID=A0A1H1L660_9ACTN|nr:NAD(P)H-quinone oxidoreductase [Friedmanniella luteola]SDR69409.1 putative NAD(P)H quinone oxidoreductase, PIG3 family [Friedmanniella luteola]
MRAVVAREAGGPEVLELVEVEDLTVGPGELLLDVTAAGVNRADLLQRQGHYPPPPGASPLIGLEVSGHVAVVGAGVEGWSVGDACVALLAGGGYAEQVVVPAGQVVAPPPGMDLVEAAGLIEVAATVVSNLDLAHLSAGEVFLVHGGAGGIGSFAIQYARSLGATVLATAGAAEKVAYCRSVGAHHAFSYRDDWAAQVRSLAPEGVDLVLDSVGARYLETHQQLMATEGRLVVIGMQGGARATLDLAALLSRRGLVTATSLRPRPPAEKAEICRRVVERVWPLLVDGTIAPTPQTTFPLAEASAAHAHLESGDHLGKLVLVVRR